MAHKDFRAPTFEANSCILFESELHPSGARHTPLDQFEFSKERKHDAQQNTSS